MERIEFAVPADEASQPSRRCGVEARPNVGGSDDLVDFDRLAQFAHKSRSERPYLDTAFGKRQHIARNHDRARSGELSHLSGQMRCLVDGGEVHAKAVADLADDNEFGVEFYASAKGNVDGLFEVTETLAERSPQV